MPLLTPARPLCSQLVGRHRDRVGEVGARAGVREAGDRLGHRRRRGRVVARRTTRPSPRARPASSGGGRSAGRRSRCEDAGVVEHEPLPTWLGPEHPERQPLGGRVVELADGVGRVAGVGGVDAAHGARPVDDQRHVDEAPPARDPQGPLHAAEVTTLGVARVDPDRAAEAERHAHRAGQDQRVARCRPRPGRTARCRCRAPQRQAEGATTPGLHVIGMSDRSGSPSLFRSPMRQRKLWRRRGSRAGAPG